MKEAAASEFQNRGNQGLIDLGKLVIITFSGKKHNLENFAK